MPTINDKPYALHANFRKALILKFLEIADVPLYEKNM